MNISNIRFFQLGMKIEMNMYIFVSFMSW